MKLKLVAIALIAAAFGWGFSMLVEHKGRSISPENARLACQEWSGGGCNHGPDR